MIKGLEALHHPRIELAKIDISAEGKQDIAYMPFYKTKQYAAIEKELKALEIIKEKGLSVNEIAFIKNGESWETYVETMKELCWGDELLDKLKTEEEYDLLGKVLL